MNMYNSKNNNIYNIKHILIKFCSLIFLGKCSICHYSLQLVYNII